MLSLFSYVLLQHAQAMPTFPGVKVFSAGMPMPHIPPPTTFRAPTVATPPRMSIYDSPNSPTALGSFRSSSPSMPGHLPGGPYTAPGGVPGGVPRSSSLHVPATVPVSPAVRPSVGFQDSVLPGMAPSPRTASGLALNQPVTLPGHSTLRTMDGGLDGPASGFAPSPARNQPGKVQLQPAAQLGIKPKDGSPPVSPTHGGSDINAAALLTPGRRSSTPDPPGASTPGAKGSAKVPPKSAAKPATDEITDAAPRARR